MRFVALLLVLALGALPAAAEENAWFTQGKSAVEKARLLARTPMRAKNVIVFLGDGMGLTTVTAARILDGQFRGEPGEAGRLAFEELPFVSLAKTYNTNQQVPDSAGTMTAILCGAKTRAGVIGVDESVPFGDAAAAAKGRLPTLVEQAEARGLATGVVSTARITHATPAAAYAHSPSRSWENDASLPASAKALDFPDIARQLIEFSHGDGIDVVLGGGRAHFLSQEASDPEYPDTHGKRRDERDLIDEWQRRYPQGRYVWNSEQLESIDAENTTHLLGLFQPDHMRFEVDRAEDAAGEPSLGELTRTAIELLARDDDGYVLVVEGGRIDHAHHMGNAHRALVDTIAFADAVRVAMQATNPEDTLLVVTADHGHVLTMGGYTTRGNPILGKVVSNDRATGEPKADFERDLDGLPYTTLGYYNGGGAPHVPRSAADGHDDGPPPAIARRDLREVDTTAKDFRQDALVPLHSETHSGEDVPVYAGGAGSPLFHGVQEQSYLYHAIVEALGWNAAVK